jgi:hypothetical protein
MLLPVVLYGCETWSLTLMEECRLRVFETDSRNEYLVPSWMRHESGEWRKVHNIELHSNKER